MPPPVLPNGMGHSPAAAPSPCSPPAPPPPPPPTPAAAPTLRSFSFLRFSLRSRLPLLWCRPPRLRSSSDPLLSPPSLPGSAAAAGVEAAAPEPFPSGSTRSALTSRCSLRSDLLSRCARSSVGAAAGAAWRRGLAPRPRRSSRAGCSPRTCCRSPLAAAARAASRAPSISAAPPLPPRSSRRPRASTRGASLSPPPPRASLLACRSGSRGCSRCRSRGASLARPPGRSVGAASSSRLRLMGGAAGGLERNGAWSETAQRGTGACAAGGRVRRAGCCCR